MAKSITFYFSSGVPRATIEACTSIYNIRSTVALDKYLGFLILKGRVKKSDFEFILEKMRSRLASWKHRFLSKPGRLALASSVLTSIPTYDMQTFWLPQNICSMIDRMTREFLWKGNTGKGIHLVGWDTITRSKGHEGLGVQRAREANTSLLGKLVWDLQHHTNKLWVKVISSKYHVMGNFIDEGYKTGSFTWNSIGKARAILREGYSMRTGAGDVSFWYEKWSKLGTLCNLVDFVAIHDTDIRVKDVFMNHEVNLNQLVTHTPAALKEEIMNLKVTLNASIPDAYIWEFILRELAMIGSQKEGGRSLMIPLGVGFGRLRPLRM